MKKVLVPVTDGFEEIETVTIVDILRRAGIDVILAGLREGPLKGSRGILLMPDAVIEDVKENEFDLVVLPGGQPGVDNLRKDPRVLEILKKRDAKKQLIGAICAAPLALRDAGISAGRHLTSHPSIEKELLASRYGEERVIVDGNFVTSRAAGTSMEFALKLAEILAGPEKAREVSRAVLANA